MSRVKLSFSNIALPAYDHDSELNALAAKGLSGIEIAPSRVWRNTWQGLSIHEVEIYRREVEAAGLEVVGLHSLLFDHPELNMFGDKKTRLATLSFLVHLSGICRDLGGKTLIFGGGRSRGSVSIETAKQVTIEMLSEYVQRTEDHGTCLCFEPLGPNDTDFINSAYDSIALVNKIDHPAFRIQLDAKALVANDEVEADTFDLAADRLVHFHANEPDLGILGSSGTVDHHFMGHQLKRIRYQGFVSVEQRMISQRDPLADLSESLRVAKKMYILND